MATMTKSTGTATATPAGIDRRTVLPALAVLALAVVMSVVLPHIDGATTYRDQVRKGEVVQVADGITLVPAAGWQLASGALVGHTRSTVGSTASSELVKGSIAFYVQAAPFAGTASALLTRVNRISSDLHSARARASARSDRYAVRTRRGATGVGQDFFGVSRQGSVVTFVFRTPAGSQGRATSEGVEIVVSGPASAISRHRKAVVAMIRSIGTSS